MAVLCCSGSSLTSFPPSTKVRTQEDLATSPRGLRFVGLILPVGGRLVFLMGISWDGSYYPWKSAHAMLQLLSDSPLSLNWYFTKPKCHLRHRWFQCTCSRICRGFWPTMVFSLYTSDLIKEGYLCCVAGCGTKTGQIVGRNLCRRLAKQKTQM